MVKNIVWDLDGTIFNTYPTIADSYVQAMNQLGFTAEPATVERLVKVSMEKCVSYLVETFGMSEESINQSFKKIYSEVQPLEIGLFDGVQALLVDIYSRSGKNIIVTHRSYAGTLELLESHQLTKYFYLIISRDDRYARKPSPEAFIAAICKSRIKLAETINVGDRDIDILAGKKAGLFSCLFLASPVTSTPDFQFSDYRELQNLIHDNSDREVILP